ncbi:MAG: polysaccharide ABC transporter ATP-binding protein [Elainellaceae cyanobacterium]
MVVGIHKLDVLPQSDSDDVVISIEQVSKKFCRDLKRSLFYGLQDIAADLVGGRRHMHQLRSQEFWALKSISFQLHRGEALGLVGTNGAGKSTLLRIISGLIKPDTGKIEIDGRIAPLIALGAGFNPILTGRENIYANMSILGLSTKDIRKKFDDVVDFAEIWDAIDAPVQTYSSGMAARLGFACAVHTEPEILLIDEVLAVGDARFKAKCYRRLYHLRQKGTSFILVNHNPQAILNTCDSAIYLSQGKLIAAGDAETIVTQYEQDLFLDGTERSDNQMTLPSKKPGESLGLDIRALFFRDANDNILKTLVSGEQMSFCVACDAHDTVTGVTLHIKISKIGGEDSMGTTLFLSGDNDNVFFEVTPGKHEIHLQMPYLGLESGTYNMSIKLKKDSIYTFDVVDSFKFKVQSSSGMSRCAFYQPRTWRLTQA